MHLTPSCIATWELVQCRNSIYIHFIDGMLCPRAEQRNVAELSRLSDRELADIGLDRSDIPRVASGAYNG
jgi:hypothetical protein